jgi:hypothetical protein
MLVDAFRLPATVFIFFLLIIPRTVFWIVVAAFRIVVSFFLLRIPRTVFWILVAAFFG